MGTAVANFTMFTPLRVDIWNIHEPTDALVVPFGDTEFATAQMQGGLSTDAIDITRVTVKKEGGRFAKKSYSVDELKGFLKSWGIKPQGNKPNLVEQVLNEYNRLRGLELA